MEIAFRSGLATGLAEPTPIECYPTIGAAVIMASGNAARAETARGILELARQPCQFACRRRGDLRKGSAQRLSQPARDNDTR